MDHSNNTHNNSHSYYQLDPQVTGDQLSSHPSHALHNAAYPDSDYQPGMGYTPSQGLHQSSNHTAVGQDSKPYPTAPGPSHTLDSIHNAAYPDSDYRPGAAYTPLQQSSHDTSHAAYPDSNYQPGTAYSPSHQTAMELPPADTVIHNAAYPDSNYRPGTSYSATSTLHGPPAGPPPNRPLPNPTKIIQNPVTSPSQSPWTSRESSSSSPPAAGPSRILVPQVTGSEPPPPPYQPGAAADGTTSPSRARPMTQTPSLSYSHQNETSNPNNPYSGYHTSSSTSSPTRARPYQENPIPMTTFPVHQNAIGHVANNSNSSSALERNYKEYDRAQAALDAKARRRNRRKWLIGTLVTTVIVAAVIGVVVAVLKKKVNDDDD